MNFSLTLFLLAASVAISVNSPAQTVQPNQSPQPIQRAPAFSIAISAPSGIVKAGSEIEVEITVTNTTKGVVGVTSAHSSSEISAFDVRDSQGNLSLTKWGRALIKHEGSEIVELPTGGGSVLFIEPGKSVTETIAIPGLYDLSRPGKYTIQVQRLDHVTMNTVKSNTITVVVTP